MKEDTKMPRKGISPVSALELAMSCSRCPDLHLPGCGGNWLVLNTELCLRFQWAPTPDPRWGGQENLPSSSPVLFSWQESQFLLPAVIFASFAFRRGWQNFFWEDSSSCCLANRWQELSASPESPLCRNTPSCLEAWEGEGLWRGGGDCFLSTSTSVSCPQPSGGDGVCVVPYTGG